MAFAESAIDTSGARLLTEKADLPGFEEGYRTWKLAFDAGRGQVNGPSIALALEELEAHLNRKSLPAEWKDTYQVLARKRPFIYQIYHVAADKTEVTAILGNDSETPGIVMDFPELPRVNTPYQSGILLGSAHYDYEGTTPSGARSGRFTFITQKKETYPDPPKFTISIEGQAAHEGEAELYLNTYEINGRKVSQQWVTLKVPIEVFLKVAEATRVEFELGARSYKPEAFQQRYLRALAKKIEPVNN